MRIRPRDETQLVKGIQTTQVAVSIFFTVEYRHVAPSIGRTCRRRRRFAPRGNKTLEPDRAVAAVREWTAGGPRDEGQQEEASADSNSAASDEPV
jgi:hypothetical protein